MKMWKSYKSKIQTEKLHANSDEAKIKGTLLLHLFWLSPLMKPKKQSLLQVVAPTMTCNRKKIKKGQNGGIKKKLKLIFASN